MNDVLLRLENITKSFSGVKVLDDVSIELKRGKVLGLVGENGAGKSTLMNILGGVLPRDDGRMELDGKPFFPINPTEASKQGIVFIHQELNLFTNLSVAENIFTDHFPRNSFGAISYRQMYSEAAKILGLLGEKVNPRILTGELPVGTRQMVEISKVLRKDVRIIIFDEPTSSLSNNEKNKLFSLIQELKEKDVSVIYISHMLDEVFRLCDDVAVLRDGKLIGQEPVEGLNTAKVIKMMVGRELSRLFPYVEKNIAEEILRVENLSQGNRLQDVSMSLHVGEIVGLFGLMGAGRSEFVRALYGLDPFDTGTIHFKDKKVAKPRPDRWIDKGVALVTENRREEGLLMSKSVSENLVLANLKQVMGPLNSLDRKKEDDQSKWAIEKLNIKTYDKNTQQATMLSGGNQQKTVVGKWLLTKPKVFLLDEPTRGIDVGAKQELYDHINSLVIDGTSVLFISSEMEELMGVCDRILIMCRGKITGELSRKEYNQEIMLELAIQGAE